MFWSPACLRRYARACFFQAEEKEDKKWRRSHFGQGLRAAGWDKAMPPSACGRMRIFEGVFEWEVMCRKYFAQDFHQGFPLNYLFLLLVA